MGDGLDLVNCFIKGGAAFWRACTGVFGECIDNIPLIKFCPSVPGGEQNPQILLCCLGPMFLSRFQCLLCNDSMKCVLPFGLTELSQFQLPSGSALPLSQQWECVQGAGLECAGCFSCQYSSGVFWYQEGLLGIMTGIMYNSRCLEEESTSQLGIKKTWAYLAQFNVWQGKGGWPGLGGRQQSASCVSGVLRDGDELFDSWRARNGLFSSGASRNHCSNPASTAWSLYQRLKVWGVTSGVPLVAQAVQLCPTQGGWKAPRCVLILTWKKEGRAGRENLILK